MPAPSISLSSITEENFLAKAKEVFQYQLANNSIYKDYCEAIGAIDPIIEKAADFPFLPISFFKSHSISSGNKAVQAQFESSGTTGQESSKHLVQDLSLYQDACRLNFENQYGALEDFTILALLPSYLERSNSSLVYMVQYFMEISKSNQNDFFLYNHDELAKQLRSLAKKNQKTLLIGVSFALLDFAEKYTISNFPNLIIMETGGMKGRKKEMIRPDLHDLLKKAFSVQQIHSEYGMTELLSQAYAKEKGLFSCPNWMNICIRQQDDPFAYCEDGQTGGINIIDLANLHSCSFIQTDDLGRKVGKQFEVLGRFDRSEVRGCNLMALH